MKSKYKPLLFTTTVRNPARIKLYLYILSLFKGQLLTDALAKKICGEAIRFGIYRPLNVNDSVKSKWGETVKGEFGARLLTDQEVESALSNNPQSHKEAGFSKGWPSRFATIFGVQSQFGLAYAQPNEPIQISKVGTKLLENIKVTVNDDGCIMAENINPAVDNAVFLNVMARYHRDNPFLRVKNANTPLVLLLKVIKLGSSCMTVGGFPPHKFAWPLFYGLLSRSSGPRNFD